MADDAEISRLLMGPLRLGNGRRPKPTRCEFVRELSVEELLQAGSVEVGIKTPHIGEIRQSHHMLARVMSQGLSQMEVSAITGYSISRISILKDDPAFAELLQYYSDMEQAQYSVARADMHERLKALGFDAIEVLHDRLRDDPDSFDPKTLLAVTEATADRTGHGKTSTVNHDHTHALSDATIARIKSATLQGREIAETDRGALLRLALDRTAEEHPEAEEADWVESGGDSLREEGGEGAEEPALSGDTALSPVASI